MKIISTKIDDVTFEIYEPQINDASWRLIRESSGTYANIANVGENGEDIEYIYEEYDAPDKRKLIDNMSDEDLIENVYSELQESGNVDIS